MVSDLQLIMKKENEKLHHMSTASRLFCCDNFQFLSQSLTCPQQNVKRFKNRHPSGVCFSSLPLLQLSLSSLVLRPLPAELINSSLVSSSQTTGLAEH
jgi:hypothetical protein